MGPLCAESAWCRSNSLHQVNKVNQMVVQDNGIAVEPRVVVVGVGGAGCNVVSTFYETMCPIDTIAINTDKAALGKASADEKLYICKDVLHGEGARGEQILGKRCADIHKDEIRQALARYNVVFVIGGLGKGTGSGAMPVVLDIAKAQGAMTFAIAINPFSFEGVSKQAVEAWNHIKTVCENSIRVENDKIITLMSDITLDSAFAHVNESIRASVMQSADLACSILAGAGQPRTDKPKTSQYKGAYPLQMLMSA